MHTWLSRVFAVCTVPAILPLVRPTLQTRCLTFAMKGIFYAWMVMRSQLLQCVLLHSAPRAGVPSIHWIQRKRFSIFVIQVLFVLSYRWSVNCSSNATVLLRIDAKSR